MGLDIYFHKTRHELYKEDYNSVIHETSADAKLELSNDFVAAIAELSPIANDKELYKEKATEWLKKLAEHFDYPEYELDKIGYAKELVRFTEPQPEGSQDEDGTYLNKYGAVGEWVVTIDPKPIEDWISSFKKIVWLHYPKECAYFRKVNLLYAYFERKGTLLDQYFSMVERDDVIDIIDRCKRVLADHSLAEELLPTQSGFFFGGTEYDEWYFNKVEDVLEQMEKILPIFDEKVWKKGEVTPEYENETYKMYVVFSW